MVFYEVYGDFSIKQSFGRRESPMERELMQDLIAWKDATDRMPLLIEGARQVGKTWLMKEFGRQHFKNIAYVNMENNAIMEAVFENYTDSTQVIRAIAAYAREEIDPKNTLIILDEVQEVPYSVSSLKYFCENASEYAVVAAGSLLGVKFPKKKAPYPVGKIQTLKLNPLSFTEYLNALGEKQLVDLLQSNQRALIRTLAPRYIRHLSDYYYVGGMPKAVAMFLNQSDYLKVRAIQLQIIEDYEHDIAKHLSDSEASRAHTLWQSVPLQLGREQGKRFLFSEFSESGRARDFKDALQWLIDARMVTKVCRISKPGIPLKAYASDRLFELFLLDVGLYSAMIELDINDVLLKNPLFEEGKGGLSEQFVCQQLIADLKVTPYYWASDKTPAQVDFVISKNGKVLPIEVKSAENLKAKSLRRFSEMYSLHGYRFSLADYKEQSWMTNIPLYAISTLFARLQSALE
jgi:predicted AAA+ superfamily ATPase